MTDDRADAIRQLLVRAEAAHGAYEANELAGRYDEAWPRWYARFMVDNGLGGTLGREPSVDDVERVLSSSWAESEASSPTPAESWPALVAERLASA
ncbi:MAG TPA: hypothetical protein VHR55_04390 [Candidatus Limnocylindria bacterium]|nr:hypothetical protein [Candidatus Limnocylindria bacterium]